MDRKYLLDSNILITAHRTLYPFDIAPGFWEQFINKASSRIVMIEQVKKEIDRGEDELTTWLTDNFDRFEYHRMPSPKVIESYREIINSINSNVQYKQSAKDEFAKIADSWLCAYGLAYNYPILTNEKYKAGARNRVLIPNVCKEFKIEYVNILDLMRETGFRL
jgi:hypothetical protein